MFISVERYVKFIKDNKLTQPQFLMLYLLRRKKFSVINMYKEAHPTEDGSMIGEIHKQDLIDRGFLEKVGEGDKASDYVITEKFNHIFLSNHFIAADEFWSLYPGYVRINGQNVPLTNMDKYAFANIYAERIDYLVDEHKEVMLDLKFGRDNNLIVSNIEKFVRSESWTKIREIRVGKLKIKEVEQDTGF